MNLLPSTFTCRWSRALLAAGLMIAAGLPAAADSTPPKIPTPPIPANAAPSPATNAAPDKHALTITADINDDDSTDHDDSGKKHAGRSDLNEGFAEALLIPLAGIVATFGAPVLVVFFLLYFRHRRRQETLATVREYLNKGLPVPPELLEDCSTPSLSAVSSLRRRKSDLSRGFQLTFIGLGITLALFVHNPHSTAWGWGLIPMVMGIGYLLSGWVQSRSPDDRLPPPGNPPAF